MVGGFVGVLWESQGRMVTMNSPLTGQLGVPNQPLLAYPQLLPDGDLLP